MEEQQDSTPELSLDAEMELIQQRQTELQAKIDAARMAQSQKVAAALAKQKAIKVAEHIAEMSTAAKRREEEAEEEAAILAELTRRRIIREKEQREELERVNKERDVQLAQRQAQAAQEAAARKAAEKQQEALAEARAHAARLEHELRMSMATLEQEFLVTETTEEKPKTLADGPLAFLFGKNAQVQQDEGLSASQNDALVRAKESLEAEVVEPVRKLKPSPCYDTSALLEKLLTPVIGFANPGKCDHYGSIYSPTHLLRTAQLIITNAKGRMSCDGFWGCLDLTLEQACAVEAEAKTNLAVEAEKIRLGKERFDAELSTSDGH